jgi:integrase
VAQVRIRGLNRTVTRAADGRQVVYWYAWKGGPRLPGGPGSPEFMAAYAEAVAARKAAHAGPPDTLAALVARYRAAPDYRRLADATRAEWARWLDRIAQDRPGPEGETDIGGLPLAALDDRRVRRDLLAWRDRWADRPRSADYAMQVLSRVLAFGLDRGELALNAAAGVAQLYDPAARGDQIWTAAELARFQAAAGSPEVAHIVRLACLTGLRRADLCRLSWAHVGDLAIVIPTQKSRGRRTQVIPLIDETRALLAEIRTQQAARHAELAAQAERKRRTHPSTPGPPQPTTVLTNTRGRPWTPDGLEAQVVDAKAKTKKTGKPGADVAKHLHDARGTFATRLRQAGLTGPEIADILGWTEARVERLLKTYVDQDAIVLSIAARLKARGKEGETD